MDCSLNLVPLPCDRTGIGFTARSLSDDSNRLHLMKGHAKHFPRLDGTQYFYIKIAGCNGCCETAKVVRIEEDVLILDRTTGAKCQCIMSNQQVSYLWDDIRVVQDIARAIGINVLSPLKYDECTRTLSVDCKELFTADCGGCGCGEGSVGSSAPVTSVPGLRGQKGEQGERGVGIAEMKISAAGELTYILTDGSARSAGRLPQAKGARGEEGPRGERGEQGAKGDDGKGIQSIEVSGTTATIYYTDNSSTQMDVSSLKGADGKPGAPGPQGPKGVRGPSGYSFQYIEVGDNAYLFGHPDNVIMLESPQMEGTSFGPYGTGPTGFAQIKKPPLNGQALIKIMQGTTVVGIGRTG